MRSRDPFQDPPRSIKRFRDNYHCYTKPVTSSYDWMGSDWVSPTSLLFETEVMQAEKWMGRLTHGEGEVIHPHDLMQDLADLWEAFRVGLRKAQMVVDRDARLGVTHDMDFRSLQWSLTLRAKCWPMVEGVTVPKRDVTW